MNMTRIVVLIALVGIVLGPWYTEAEYNWVKHTISELAAQNTRNAWVMQIGLVALGVGILIDFFRKRNPVDIPFAAFGVFIALTGFLPHRPIVEDRPYNTMLDFLHSVFAFLTGLSAILGFVVRWIDEVNIPNKVIYFSLAILYTVLSFLMTIFPECTGVFQRIIFGTFLIWAFFDFPRKKMNQTNCIAD